MALKLALYLMGFAGFVITRSPTHIDQTPFLGPLAGGVLVFLFWWAGLVGWGRRWARLLEWPMTSIASKVSGSLALGSVFAYLSVCIFMWLIPSGWPLRLSAYLWAAMGVQLLPRHTHNPEMLESGMKWRSSAFGLTLFALTAVALRLLQGIHLHEHGDPLLCYLVGPRLWFDAHRFQPFLNSPIQFLASAWDYLNQWSNFFFATEPGTALAEGQRFGQWTSAVVGYAGVGAVLWTLMEDQGVHPTWTAIAVIAGLSVPSLRWTASLAKHDLGVCFWALASLIPLRAFDRQVNLRLGLTAGVLLGAAVIAKPTSALFAFVVTATLGIRMMKREHWKVTVKFLGSIAAGSVIATAPILLRNIIWTQNPLFPWLSVLFHDRISGPHLASGFSGATASTTPLRFELLISYLKEAASQNALNLASIALLIAPLNRRLATLGWITWITTLIFCISIRKNTEIRYLGPALPLLAALGVAGINRLTQFVPRLEKQVLLFAGALVVAMSDTPFFLLFQLDSQHFKSPAQEILGHFGGTSKRWLREHATPSDRILSIGDNEIYYTLPLQITDLLQHPESDRAFNEIKNSSEVIPTLKRLRIRYYYRAPVTRTSQSHRALHLLDEALKGDNHCLRFQDGRAQIYDVQCLPE